MELRCRRLGLHYELTQVYRKMLILWKDVSDTSKMLTSVLIKRMPVFENQATKQVSNFFIMNVIRK